MKGKFLALCVLVALLAPVIMAENASPAFCHGLDCPKYKVIETTSDYEVRAYEATKWVSTTINGFHFVDAQRLGFNRLFKYISGANAEKEKVPMTCPVRNVVTPSQGPFCKTEFTISFFVPFAYIDKTPAPSSSEIFIEETPAKKVYVKSFGGYMTEDGVIKHASELMTTLQKKGIDIETENYYACGYDSPFRLIRRHNEIWILAKDTEASSGSIPTV